MTSKKAKDYLISLIERDTPMLPIKLKWNYTIREKRKRARYYGYI